MIEKGLKYNELTTTGNWYRKNNLALMVEAVCSCGVIKYYYHTNINGGTTKSCGCLRKKVSATKSFKHGFARRGSRNCLFEIYMGIKQRCYDENSTNFKNYGAIGVVMCPEWYKDFKVFYDWCMANGWRKGLQIDKDKLAINHIGKIYSPEFCSILTRKENMQYRRNSVLVKYNGKTKSMIEWCEIKGMSYKLVHDRLRNGWTAEDALNTPTRKRKAA